jgi:hypothetical protein
MIQTEEVLGLITDCYPTFTARWNEESLFWPDEGKAATACGILCEFSHLIAEELEAKRVSNIPAVFALIEQLLAEGSEEVMDAAATCFLENVHNRVPEKIAPDLFVPFLGPLSQEYCRAWDRFCGTETEGLG